MKLLSLFLFLFASAANHAGATHQQAVSRIEVTKRYPWFTCGGICVDQRLIVAADGNVWWEIIPHEGRPGKLHHFSVKASAAAKYILEMNAVRPTDNLSDRVGCDAKDHDPNIWDWDVAWVGKGRSTRLRTCDADEHVYSAWQAALKALGIPGGIGELIEKM